MKVTLAAVTAVLLLAIIKKVNNRRDLETV
jgi:hypothetical protein